MASDMLKKGAKTYGVDLKSVALRIYPNSTSEPTWDAEGGVSSVTRSAAGKYLVTLTQPYYKVRRASATFQHEADNVDLYAQIGEFNNVFHNGAQIGAVGQPVTFVVKLKTGTSNTDVAASAQCCIFVEVEFEDATR